MNVGTAVTRIALMMILMVWGATPAAGQYATATTNGNTIIATVSIPPNNGCCAGASIDTGCQLTSCTGLPSGGGQCTGGCGFGYDFTFEFTCNTLGTHTIYAYWYNATTQTQCLTPVTVTVTDPAPSPDVTISLQRDAAGAYSARVDYSFPASGGCIDRSLTVELLPTRSEPGQTYFTQTGQGGLPMSGTIVQPLANFNTN